MNNYHQQEPYNNDNILNIENLTDDEIYNILEVEPTVADNILEAVIRSKIQQYENTDQDLASFFTDIYDYFFTENVPPNPHPKHHPFTNEPTRENFTDYNSNQKQCVINTSIQPLIEQPVASLQQIVQYKADNLNPLLKETITKTLTINSFDRDNKTDVATNYSLTLSESLNNIVSLKLYSVQIPYTWYTINNNIGSNYFVLQGTSPGINDGKHNIFIDISSGNYTPITLSSAIQTSINQAKTVYSDISFGETKISYNTSTALTTFKFDIQKRFNETDYYLAFPSYGWTNPNDPETANTSLAGFLGFNYINYFPFTLLSNQTQLPLSTSTATGDATLSIYYITSLNNYCTIVQYIPQTAGNTFNITGYNAFINSQTIDPTTTYVQSFDIKLSLAINSYYTRNQLFNDIANQIAAASFLDKTLSEIIRVDVNNQQYINYGFSYFEMKLKLNRYTTQTYQNQKCALLFPDESTSRIPIWVGSNSCFHYDISVNELNNIYSETPSNIDTFLLNTTPFIAFVCTKPGYNVAANNYSLLIDTLTLNTPITFSQYQTAINQAFTTAQNNSINNFNPYGDFNINNTYIGLDISSNAQFSIDINKNMTEEKYIMDISNQNNFFYNTLRINNPIGGPAGPSVIDLSDNNIFNSTFPLVGGGYTPFYDNAALATFTLKTDFQNTASPPSPYVLTGPSETTYSTVAELQTGINNIFSTFQDDNNQYPLSGSSVILTINQSDIPPTVSCTLKINVDKILTQFDYIMVLSDLSNNTPANVINYTETSVPNYVNTTWNTNLTFTDISFSSPGFIPLSRYQTPTASNITFSGSQPIGISSFEPLEGKDVYKQFFIVPQSSGLTDIENSNVLSYTLKNDKYTKIQVIQEINTFFNTNPFTLGSSISIIEQNGKEIIQFRLNINKTFRAYDYNLVFYSPYNTPACSTNYNYQKFTTWDTCLGWILGFKSQTQYALANHWNYTDNTAQITGDSVLSVFLYNSFIIVLNDYTHNHLNNGLVTIAKGQQNYQDNTIPTTYQSIIQPVVSTQQNYGLNQEINAQTPAQNIYSPGIYLNDVFGIIPMDTSTLTNNQIFVQIASTLQDQKRIYFGPVNIYRMGISLYTDRGQIIDLNGADWSFQLIAEELYIPTK
jgi:hypothetical protein